VPEFKPSKNFFTILLGALVVILLAFGILRMKFGQFLPDVIDKNLPDAVIIAAIGIMLWNRQILNQEKKEAEARKKAEADAAAARIAGPEDAEKEAGSAGPTETASKGDRAE
jgi:hypothetical protein